MDAEHNTKNENNNPSQIVDFSVQEDDGHNNLMMKNTHKEYTIKGAVTACKANMVNICN